MLIGFGHDGEYGARFGLASLKCKESSTAEWKLVGCVSCADQVVTLTGALPIKPVKLPQGEFSTLRYMC